MRKFTIILTLIAINAFGLYAASKKTPPVEMQQKVEVPAFDQLDFNIYPNPATSGPISLEIENVSNNVKVRVYNTIGRTLFEENMDAFGGYLNYTINFNEKLTPGLYFVSVSSKQQNISKKLIIRD